MGTSATTYNADMKRTESSRLEFFRLSPLEWSVGLVLTFLILLQGAISDLGVGTIFVALLTLLLIWRRQWPVAVFFGVSVSALFTTTPYFTIIAIMIATYAVGLYSRHNIVALGLLFGVSALLVFHYDDPAPHIPARLFPFLILTIAWLFAWAVRQQQTVTEVYRERSSLLESEQEQATRAARAEERRRIAREMHDVIAHSVSVMVVQAGAARSVLQTSPEEATMALLAVEDTGRETLAELRGLLGVLSDNDALDLTPQPGLDQFETLIERVKKAGLPVAVTIQGEPCGLSSSLNLTAYRVLQEALTNVLKHADHAQTDVILTYGDDELKLEVFNAGTNGRLPNADRSGRGLVGMRERVALFGGRLETGPRLGGGYAVRAWLPLTEANA